MRGIHVGTLRRRNFLHDGKANPSVPQLRLPARLARIESHQQRAGPLGGSSFRLADGSRGLRLRYGDLVRVQQGESRLHPQQSVAD